MVEWIRTNHIDSNGEFAAEVRALLNEAYPDGAPNELDGYYRRHGLPAATILLREDQGVIGHLAIYERDIMIGNEAVLVGLLGEIAVAVDRRRLGFARSLVRQAHAYLQARSIPFSILFACEPRVYVSSGYKLMRNQTRVIEADGQCRTFVYRGGMYAELKERPWPDQLIDLRGTAV